MSKKEHVKSKGLTNNSEKDSLRLSDKLNQNIIVYNVDGSRCLVTSNITNVYLHVKENILKGVAKIKGNTYSVTRKSIKKKIERLSRIDNLIHEYEIDVPSAYWTIDTVKKENYLVKESNKLIERKTYTKPNNQFSKSKPKKSPNKPKITNRTISTIKIK